MSKCKHQVCNHGYDFEVRECLDCGEWLSLGPANDVGVDVEILLAVHLQENALLFETSGFRDQADEIVINAALVALESP